MEKAKSYALRLLSKRDYFEEELRRKLLQKGFQEEDIHQVIEYLKKENLINDDKLLERYKEINLQKGKSPLYIKNKLYRKGVKNIDFSYEEELDAALYLLKFKFRREKNYTDIVKFLRNRGFSYTVIQEAANKFLNGEE
ncbi:regulatory protein [Persephonella hydrogeniphila]|uniref:Regulatory protein RecX n=1 Tax=Persephonella hydrogeniphila TaxID=198703 RepID=A0A285NA77_9AQUI|nr:regulatory protein RecX [Persephonella hydrogeniphila]SNZ06339.1 regulatory protein [Persephonella hydrogeniphila]